MTSGHKFKHRNIVKRPGKGYIYILLFISNLLVRYPSASQISNYLSVPFISFQDQYYSLN